MQVFIFGAGASKGSQLSDAFAEDHRAPLVNDIFDPRYNSHAHNVHLPLSQMEEYRNSLPPDGSLEEWLTDWWERSESAGRQRQHADKADFGRISFYMWQLFQAVSNTYSENNLYRLLLKKIRASNSGDFGLISFNYDTLLDKAYQEVFGYPSGHSIEKYFEANFIKPHGSVNWFMLRRHLDPVVPGHIFVSDPGVRINIASNSMYNGGELPLANVVVMDPTDDAIKHLNFINSPVFQQTYFYPLILMPLSVKLYPLVAAFHGNVMQASKDMIAQATDIYLVGYRASDEIANTMLSNAPDGTHLHVVGTNSAPGIMAAVLEKRKNLKKGKLYQDGFEGFVEKY